MADDDKMVDRGDAVSGLGDSKQDFKPVDGGRAVVEDTEAAIQEDVEVAKVEAVYRYVITDSYSWHTRLTIYQKNRPQDHSS